ncbi:lipase 1-like [Armigeres subalbatus]|uniref:lipase 1-like n=1 Tax=Armigeres subalbatus TaxID=124917 RepID=UPI002ED5D97E
MFRSEGTLNQLVLLLLLVLASIAIVAGRAVRRIDNSFSDRSRTEDYITQYEINTERYRVTTEDGYQLTVFRLLPQVPTRGVALIQHGIGQSSADWLALNRNLPMQLLEVGIEVWLGNSRASLESAGHISYSTSSSKYWDFSFHEIGIYDLASMIDAVLQITRRSQLHLIAYSEGSSAALTLLSERPEYNAKVTSLNLMAPAAFMANSQLKPIALLFDKIRVIFPGSIEQLLASNKELSRSSQKQYEHYQQLILTGHFRRFDYGPRRNNQRYGSREPPDYPLLRISRPVVLHYGGRDRTVNPKDVEYLSTRLSNRTGAKLVEYNILDHTDFTNRPEAAVYVYPMVVQNIVSTLGQRIQAR